MAAAGAKEGVPLAVLKQAKSAGADGFDASGRVDMADFFAWYFSQGEENVNWTQRLKRAQALGAEMELERVKGELVPIEEVYRQQDQCIAKARAILVQKFETELPPKQDGMPAEKIAETNLAGLDAVFAILSKRETYA